MTKRFEVEITLDADDEEDARSWFENELGKESVRDDLEGSASYEVSVVVKELPTA